MQKQYRDFNNAVIIKSISPDGHRNGAIIKRQGLPDMRLDGDGLIRLNQLLSVSGQRLSGASVSVDGKILSDPKTPVHEVIETPVQFATAMRATGTIPDYMSVPASISGGYGYVPVSKMNLREQAESDAKELLREFKTEPSVTDQRLMSNLCAGLQLLRNCGIDIAVSDISREAECRGRYAPYLRVAAFCPGVRDKYEPNITFEIYLNDTADLVVHGIDSLFPKNIRCKSASDVRNAILWLCADSGKASDKICDEYNKRHADAELLLSESERTNALRPEFVRVSLPHKQIGDTVREHIRDFKQLQAALNRQYGNLYDFKWCEASDNTAILSVAKRVDTAQNIESEELLGLRFEIIPTDYKINPYENESVHRAHTFKALRLSHRLTGERWTSLQEYGCIKFLDEAADAVGSILKAVFSSGALRNTQRVFAYEISAGQRRYFIRGEETPISEQDLLKLATEGAIVDGVNLRVLSDGTITLATQGYDRYGNAIPEVKPIRNEENKDSIDSVHLKLGFQDIWKDEWLSFTAVIPLEIYNRLQRTERNPSIELTHPVSYINAMLIEARAQKWVLTDVVGEQLARLAAKQGYNKDNFPRFLLSFMRQCFVFSPLADTLRGNQTPVETLIDRRGCCVELALLAVPLAQAMGFDASVIFRYTPELKTDFHAVLGMKYVPKDLNALESWKNGQNYSNNKESLSIAFIGGYTGIELSDFVHGRPGIVTGWSNQRNADAVCDTAGSETPGQVVVVPVTEDLSCGVPAAQAADTTVIPLSAAHWKTVQKWFVDKSNDDI